MSPYLWQDAKILVHGCGEPGAKVPFENIDKLMKALPKGVQLYVHDILAGPGMPINWIKYQMIQTETDHRLKAVGSASAEAD